MSDGMWWLIVAVLAIGAFAALWITQELEWRKTRSFFHRIPDDGWHPGVPEYDDYQAWKRVVEVRQRRRMTVNLSITVVCFGYLAYQMMSSW